MSDSPTLESLNDQVDALYNECLIIKRDVDRWLEQGHIEGLYRFDQMITAEMKFLNKLRDTDIDPDQVKSSNLCYLDAVHKSIIQSRNVVAVMKNFSVKDTPIHYSGRSMVTVKVDVVAEEGLVWIRVNARNAKGLRHEIAGLEEDSDFDSDEEHLDDHVVDNSTDNLALFRKANALLASAERHLVHFRKPIVVYAFMRYTPGEDRYVEEQIISKLSNMGIMVYTKSESVGLSEVYSHIISPLVVTDKVNLDVSTVLALISELSHRPGVTSSMVRGEALQLQATQELSNPILPNLANLLGKKQLYVTQSALDKLNGIVNIVGGPNEKARFDMMIGTTPLAKDLWVNYNADLSYLRLTVMEDKPTQRFLHLLDPPESLEQRIGRVNNGRKIRSKFNTFHVNVFGTGDANKMTTITSIAWMKKALQDAGLAGVAIVEHDPRSLAEQKLLL
ncbi:hypothetical protein Unana1_00831 [Umbelopsis nana]